MDFIRSHFVMKEVFNWSEVHLSEVTSYKIHTLSMLLRRDHKYVNLLTVLLSIPFYKLPWFFSVSIITCPKDFLSFLLQSWNQAIEQDICLSALSSIISKKKEFFKLRIFGVWTLWFSWSSADTRLILTLKES